MENLEQSHAAEAAALAARCEHEMVDNGKVHCFACSSKLPSGFTIARAGGRIAAWVVMRQHHARAAKPGGVGDNRSHGKSDRADMAVVAGKMDATCGIIEMRDPQLLVARRRIIETWRKEAARGKMTGQDRGVFGTLNLHASQARRGAVACPRQPGPKWRDLRAAKGLDPPYGTARVGRCAPT